MNKEQKAAVVQEVASQIEEAEALFAVDYRGISVPQAAELRQKLNDAGATFRVVKNSLTELAAEKAGVAELKELLDGPTALTFVPADGDPVLAAKALATFRREHDLLEFKGGRMEANPLSAEEIQALARLPARDVLNAQLVGLVASPITGLVRGLNALIAGLAVQLKQIADQGLVGGGEEAAAEAEPAEEAPAAEAEPAEETAAEAEPAEEAAQAEPAPEAAEESEETESPSSGGDEEEKEA